MSDFSGEFDNSGPEDVINLLPERCRSCDHAQLMVGILSVFASSTGNAQVDLIEDISQRCPGYVGAAEADTFIPLKDIDQDMPQGLVFPTSKMRSERECPYELMTDEEDDF